MRRHLIFALALGAALCADSRSSAGYPSGIIPQTDAARHGLKRAWFTQIQADRGRGRVTHVTMDRGMLFVETDRAMLHVIDAQTGATVWAKQVGRRDHPSLPPGANDKLVAVVNGSSLYVMNRFTGRLLWQTKVDGAPGAGPALSRQWAFVPMVSGLVMAYHLEPLKDPLKELGKTEKKLTPEEQAKLTPEEKKRRESLRHESIALRQESATPLACQSFGRILVQPIVTRQEEGSEFVAWPTDRGFLFVGHVQRGLEDRFTMKYKLTTEAEIVGRPTFMPPRSSDQPGASGVVYATSQDGFVYALREDDGQSLWRFSTGEPILQPAVVITDRIYLATQLGGMYCLDAQSGAEIWWTPQVLQFVAASGQRIYAADKLGRILVLNAKTGARVDAFRAEAFPVKLINSETDRIYLATETGLIQCLHELELPQPIRHGQRPAAQPKDAEKPAAEAQPPEPGAAEAENPFAKKEAGGDQQKPPAKKPSAKKPSAKKLPAKKPPAKTLPARKPSAKRLPARKPSARKLPARKPSARKLPAKKPSGDEPVDDGAKDDENPSE